MSNQTVKIAAIAAIVLVAIVFGVMWRISATRDVGPRPGIDVPLRGM
ncbi:MAG: hypothetical protein ACK47B_07600 [Armatimonadota bacterium]